MYTGPALIDMALHALPNGTPVNIVAFEAEQAIRLEVSLKTLASATTCRISSTCLPVRVMPLATMSRCGPRCWRPMALKRLPRRATRLTLPLQSACCVRFTARVTPTTQLRPTGVSWARSTRGAHVAQTRAACEHHCLTPIIYYREIPSMSIWKKPISVELLTAISVDTATAHLGIEFLEVGEDFIRPASVQMQTPTLWPVARWCERSAAETLGSCCFFQP